MTREAILEAAKSLRAPKAIQAYWDGDTHGWFVILAAVDERVIAVIREGGDIRLFDGTVPPWPEAVLAKQVGEEIAARFGIPFWFPAVDHPEDDAALYEDRDRAIPCRVCAIPLIQKDPCPWKGTCYRCHLEGERAAK
jgi:hypothetical protein